MSTCFINMYRYYGTPSVAVDSYDKNDAGVITSHSGYSCSERDTEFNRVWRLLPQMSDLYELDEEG